MATQLTKTFTSILLALMFYIVYRINAVTILFSIFITGIVCELYPLRHSRLALIGYLFTILTVLGYFFFISSTDRYLIIAFSALSDFFQEISGKMFGTSRIGWVSPNKTIEGYVGGLFLMLIVNSSLYYAYSSRVVVILYFAGVLGDLFFSLVKRYCGIKDFSHILGSHGGILDRSDSVMGAYIAKTILCIV